MRVSNLLVLLVACAAPKPVEPLTCPPPPPAPRGLQGAADLTEAQVKERSHAFLDAFDRASVDDIQDALAPSFVWYKEQGARDKAGLVGVLQRRTDRHAPIHSRTYKDEHVYMSGNAAVFIGESIERMPPTGDSAAVEDDGSNTLVWVRSGPRRQRGGARGLGPAARRRARVQPQAEPAARRDHQRAQAGRRARPDDGAGPQRGVPRDAGLARHRRRHRG